MDKLLFKPYVMIIDDEADFNESLEIALEDSYVISSALSLNDARRLLQDSVPDIVLLDIHLSDGDGIAFLPELMGLSPAPIVIMMTAYAAIDSTVEAIKEGASNYFVKPLDIVKLKTEINLYLENRALNKRITALNKELTKIKPPFITSEGGAMKEIVEKVPLVAPLNMPILITGETGTGKERLAEWIHSISGVKGALVSINCSAIAKDLFESEFFGHARGAFSGAVAEKEGLIEQAAFGTLLLDEIGDLKEEAQLKLLRVLENGTYYRVGENKERRISFRLIAATNADFNQANLNFRKDLFYRISGITFHLPPLRNRKEEITLLTNAFIAEANKLYGKNIQGVDLHATDCLMDHRWPGNIRELRWTVHRAVAVASTGMLTLDDISICAINIENETSLSCGDEEPGPMPQNTSLKLEAAVEELEKRYILEALRLSGNIKTEAAKLLGVSARTLHYKIKSYKIPD